LGRGAEKHVRKGHGVSGLEAGGFTVNGAGNGFNDLDGKVFRISHDFASHFHAVAPDKAVVNFGQVNNAHINGNFTFSGKNLVPVTLISLSEIRRVGISAMH
jgi:hypothetical protein